MTNDDILAEVIRLIKAGEKDAAQQAALFPETNPLLDEIKDLGVNALSPIEALNKLFEWQRKYRRE